MIGSEAATVAAVVAAPDPLRDEEVMACVVRKSASAASADEALARELVEFCLARLAYYKVPGYVSFCVSLPLTPTEKIQRGQLSERSLAIAAEVTKVAQETNASPSQVAIAWVRQGPALIVPLVGARTVEQLKDNLGCLDLTLSPEQKARLDAVSAIEPGFPHEMLSAQSDQRARTIDNHRAWMTP